MTNHALPLTISPHPPPHRRPRPRLARHALPPPGEPARRRHGLRRPDPRPLARSARHRRRDAPAYTRDWAEASGRETLIEAARRHLIEIAPSDAQPGDVLVFRWRRHTLAKHCAILTAPTAMIHALEGAPVSEVAFTPWWRRHLAAAFAFPEVPPLPVLHGERAGVRGRDNGSANRRQPQPVGWVRAKPVTQHVQPQRPHPKHPGSVLSSHPNAP